jgi:hypothetical protein
VRPADQGLWQHERTRQGQPAAHAASTWPSPPALPDPAACALAIAAARSAALQDEAGTQLDAALRAHGAPARALREQPIRWMRKPRTAE